MTGERTALAVGLGIGVVVGSAYLGAAAHLRPEGGFAVQLKDAYLFYQYAAAWSGGHPYAFMPGDAPSTGSTSHLYPLLLALPHALGARGDALSVAAASLSFASFLVCIALLASIARHLAPRAVPLAVVLCATSGHLASSLFDQTDATLSVPLTLGSFAALLHGRRTLLAVCLVLLSAARPDGFVVALALLLASALPGAQRPAPRRALVLAAGLGIAAFGGTLVLNAILTGSWVPDSVEATGLFRDYPPVGALYLASRAVGSLFVELFLGIGDDVRRMYLLPVVGGLLAAVGFASRSREGALFERFVLLAVLGTLAVGILGGGSGVHRDRYLAWALPLVLVYAAAGARVLADAIARPALFAPLGIALCTFQLAGAVFLWSSFADGCARAASSVRFVKRVAETLPAGSRLGMVSGAGLAYFLPDHHVTNVHGVVSPAFAYPDHNLTFVELMRRRPELRFDYWLLKASTAGEKRPFLGRALARESAEINGSDPLLLFAADWSSLEEPAPSGAPERPLARLEVGLPSSERAHRYRVRARVPGAWIEPTLVTGGLGGSVVSDVGRVVLGGETFRLPVPPSGRGRLVLRTSWRADALVRTGARVRRQRFHMETPLPLVVRVNGETVASPRLPLEAHAERIQEFPLDLSVPDARHDAAWLEIETEGDFVSLGYRWYDASQTEGAP